MSVITVPKVQVEKHNGPVAQIQESEQEATAHSEATSPCSPQRLVSVDLSTRNKQQTKKEFALSMVEINKKNKKKTAKRGAHRGGPREATESGIVPVLQEFGPLKTRAFPIDPEYKSLRANGQPVHSKGTFHRRSRTIIPGPMQAGGAVRNSHEDERAIHTQLIPTSYPIPASNLLERRSSAAGPPSKARPVPSDASPCQASRAAPPLQNDFKMSPRLYQMKATPKFKHNERQRVKDQLQLSIDQPDQQDAL